MRRMNLTNFRRLFQSRVCFWVAVAVMTLGAVGTASATIAQTPLFVGTKVAPNIMLLVDDSGSMAWADMPAPGTQDDYGADDHDVLPRLTCGDNYYGQFGCTIPAYPNDYTDDYTDLLPVGAVAKGVSNTLAGQISIAYVNPYTGRYIYTNLESIEKEVRLLSCHGYNSMAYDPNQAYTPWDGTDSNGNPFQNQSITSAEKNPMKGQASGNVIDLSNQVYFKWTDSNGNGQYDPGECGDISSDSNGVLVSSLSAAQQTNYANWYTYYHTRVHVAKAALSGVVSESEARLGLVTINGNSTPVPVKTMTTSGNRSALEKALFDITPKGGTPLRMSLDDIFRYFQKTGTSKTYHQLNLDPTWASPILPQSQGGECQQNFDVMMTDGYWNGSYPGQVSNPAGNADLNYSQSTGQLSYEDNYSNTLADVAMRAFNTDLAPGLANDVPTEKGVDENDEQHLDTFTVGLGVSGTLTSNPPNKSDAFTWPQPQADTPTAVDDLRHAAWDGHGQYLQAHDPHSLESSLQSAFASIRERTGSASAVTFSGTSLVKGTHLYQSLFNTDGWTGNVHAFPVDPKTGSIGQLDWSAAKLLDARAPDSREILTYNNGQGVAFTWSNLSSTMQSDLEINTDGTQGATSVGQARLAFLRGDRSNEGHNLGFRVRTSVLGDIVHSSPVYVGKPSDNWPDTAPFPDTSGNLYTDYVANEANRTPMVYVGANDGMLHAFNANTGQEAFAYVPSNLASAQVDAGLHYLTNPEYSHQYYVDATPTAADAYFVTPGASTAAWHTVLVGGEGAGGQGLYALNVTQPGQISQSTAAQSVLWQFTNQVDPDLGYTMSKPVIALLNNGHWAVIVGNGPGSTSGQASLFVIYLSGPINGQWVEGTNYFKFTTGVGSSTNPDALMSPAAVDLDGNGTVDRVYAGDTQGNLWAFNLCGASGSGSCNGPSKWGVAYQSGSTPVPLFSGDASHPITAPPVAVVNPAVSTASTLSDPNMMVYVGSGAYFRKNDNTDTTAQRFYGIWDTGQGGLTTSSLQQQSIIQDTQYRVLSSNSVNYSGSASSAQQFGWYLTLDSGERVTGRARVAGSNVYFDTTIPSQSPCSGGGTGYLMSLDLVNGVDPNQPAFDVNRDYLFNGGDYITGPSGKQVAPAGKRYDNGLPSAVSVIGSYRYVAGTKTPKIAKDMINLGTPASTGGRIGWIQLSQ